MQEDSPDAAPRITTKEVREVKTVRLPPSVIQILETKAQQFGLSEGELVEMLLLTMRD